MTRPSPRKARPPLHESALRDLALRYAARYATTRAKLNSYLRRKLLERGWAGDDPPDVDGIVERFAELNYVDDAGFATMKGGALTRRGYGARRISDNLRAAGVEEADREDAEAQAARDRWQAAEIFARRKRIGPFAREAADRPLREKQIAAFLRAGHDMATARAWVGAAPGEVPDAPEG